MVAYDLEVLNKAAPGDSLCTCRLITKRIPCALVQALSPGLCASESGAQHARKCCAWDLSGFFKGTLRLAAKHTAQIAGVRDHLVLCSSVSMAADKLAAELAFKANVDAVSRDYVCEPHLGKGGHQR